jgi:DNA polymerase-3 subunit epsilon
MIITVFDTETTGIPSTRLLDLDKQPEIIEFMAIKYDLNNDKILKEYEFLINPNRPISSEIVDITGITNQMVENAKKFSFYIDDVRDALENTEIVIAHNLSFDKEILEIELERIKQTITWPRLLCTIEQSMMIKGYRLNLTDLHRELTGELFAGAHRARNDVEALLRCVKVLNIRGFI